MAGGADDPLRACQQRHPHRRHPSAQRRAALAGELQKQLIPYLDHGKGNEILEIGLATGLRGDANDAPMLESLLKNPDPDARIGAANGLLKLLK